MDEFNNSLLEKKIKVPIIEEKKEKMPYIEEKTGEKEKGVEEKVTKTKKKKVTIIELDEKVAEK